MSKPDLPGGQSLEEILASIRKTLADDRPDEGLSKLDDVLMNGADHPAGALNGSALDGGRSLRDQLAVALDAAPERHSDEDLSDLLASEVPMGNAAPKPQMNGQGRDPLWFLSRGSATPDAGANPAPVAATPPEEIKLTRPETVRRSFPPLFGSGETTTRPIDLPTERVKPAEAVTPAPAKVAPDKPVEPVAAVAAKPVEAPKPATKVEVPKPAAKVEVLPLAEPEPDLAKPEPMVDLAPLSALEPETEIAPEPAGTPATGAPSPATADPAAEPHTQMLQQAIGRMLEPVIQQWLDANLPRMVEAAIREEVTRQVKTGSRGELKI